MQTKLPHTNFFSSLKQVEKRLKLENSSDSSVFVPPPAVPVDISWESLSSPIYLNLDQPNNSSTLQDSEPPRQFLSNSLGFPPTQEVPFQLNSADQPRNCNEFKTSPVDDIEQLVQLLGLSHYKEEATIRRDGKFGLCARFDHEEHCCACDDRFYANTVRVKGPRCMKEVQRLDGWVNHFSSDGGEPLRLVHLLLGKASFVNGCSDDGFEGLEFPSTVEEFLHTDPPTD